MGTVSIERRAQQLLAQPERFREMALAFPAKVDAALKLISDAGQVAAMHDKADLLEHYAHRVKTDTMTTNAITYGKLKIESRLGELLPAMARKETGEQGGRGKTKGRTTIVQPFHRNTIVKFRQVAAHKERIDEYYKRASKAEEPEEMSTAAFVKFTRQESIAQPVRVNTPPLPTGKYRAIVIDPPWPMQKIVLDRRPVEKEAMAYPPLRFDEIIALPVVLLASEDGCHVYLWVTHKFLPDGLRCFEAWGVRYECVLTWNKPTAQPLWWRFLTEHCLFGKIGSLPLLEKGHAVSFTAPQQKHSHKPDQFFDLVRAVSPEPRLTMFDYDRNGFTRWGITH